MVVDLETFRAKKRRRQMTEDQYLRRARLKLRTLGVIGPDVHIGSAHMLREARADWENLTAEKKITEAAEDYVSTHM